MIDAPVKFHFFWCVVCGHYKVVHIVEDILWIFLQYGCKIVSNDLLKVWGSIVESEVHDPGDVGPKRGFESCLVLVFLCDAHILVPPPDIELREELLPGERL